ncbi:MAG: hypothetical protein DBX38_04595 [Eubacteriales Family XIII. Incertae Sedis bacterium]|nr:MAG: hypothetical protein DBX38_04595 [Clostridiales Family XIII bacterium]
MILTDLIKEQALQSIIMFSAGLGLGMLYQVWGICRNALVRHAEDARNARIAAREVRILERKRQEAEKEQGRRQKTGRKMQKLDKRRKAKKTKPPARTHIPAVSAVLEFAFWPFAAFFVSEFMYYAAYGDLSFHNFLALGLGVLLWRKAFYDIVY